MQRQSTPAGKCPKRLSDTRAAALSRYVFSTEQRDAREVGCHPRPSPPRRSPAAARTVRGGASMGCVRLRMPPSTAAAFSFIEIIMRARQRDIYSRRVHNGYSATRFGLRRWRKKKRRFFGRKVGGVALKGVNSRSSPYMSSLTGAVANRLRAWRAARSW